ncbi:GNAT family N-acetyltransferase [Sphingomonas sp. H39-1-10]|uniref:GNAT family N-acetyltransferase n=1 Tax=Sphingomonas pollutisoli TaxID=3030829 RepID=UPI0023B93C34|nr:GNAT family N-acetyltransferase [Sphingomonas pollutisoli]MDF0489443.1 GNAT family N-acetyltransferase [Sphingomonas pollutisoli]
MLDPVIRTAVPADLPNLHPVIERAYRGDAARAGWTHEADLLDGERIDRAALAAIVADPAARLLVAVDGGVPIGCVQVSDHGGGTAYLGLLCIEPLRQAAGLGRRLIAAAETTARDTFGAHRIEMTVIENRTELIAYYERRGYARTGERRDFPIAVQPPLFMTVLAKPL